MLLIRDGDTTYRMYTIGLFPRECVLFLTAISIRLDHLSSSSTVQIFSVGTSDEKHRAFDHCTGY